MAPYYLIPVPRRLAGLEHGENKAVTIKLKQDLSISGDVFSSSRVSRYRVIATINLAFSLLLNVL
jgi:hypothetical protein